MSEHDVCRGFVATKSRVCDSEEVACRVVLDDDGVGGVAGSKSRHCVDTLVNLVGGESAVESD